jgi:hypothetical protein
MQNEVTVYIIKKGPFYGSTQSIIYTDAQGVERVAYSGKPRVMQGDTVLDAGAPDLTWLEYIAERGDNFERISEAQLDKLMQAHFDSLKSPPQAISKERFWELLECLPPSRWQNISGAEVFHVSERLSGNLVQWCARIGANHYAFTDDAALSVEKLREILDALQWSKFEKPNWYLDAYGLELCEGDAVRVITPSERRGIGPDNQGAKAVVKSFVANKNGVRVELEYSEPVSRPLAKYIPHFFVELIGLDKCCAEEAKHYKQTRAQRSKQSAAMAKVAESVTELMEIGRA